MASRKESFPNLTLKVCFIFVPLSFESAVSSQSDLSQVPYKRNDSQKLILTFSRSRIQFVISMLIYILKCTETSIPYTLDNRSRQKKKKEERRYFSVKFLSRKIEILLATQSNGQTRCNNYSSPLIFPHYSVLIGICCMGLARNTHRPKTNNKINKNPTTSYTPISRSSTQHFSFATFNSFTHSTRFLYAISRSTEHAARSCTRLTNGRDNTTCTRVQDSSVFSARASTCPRENTRRTPSLCLSAYYTRIQRCHVRV